MAHELNPVTIGLLAASAGFLDPRGGLLGGFQSGMQGYQSAVEHNRNNMLQAQMQRKMQDEEDVRNAFSQFGRPDESGNVDHGAIFKQMMGSGNPALVQYALMNAPKMQPKVKGFNKVLDPNGVARYQAMFDNGTFGEMSGAPAAERLMQSNTGGAVVFSNPFNAQPVAQMQRTIDPGQAASLAQSAQQFGARMAQDRDQFNQTFNLQAAKHMFDRQQADRPQFKDGFFVTPPTATNPQGQIMETPLSTPPKGSQMDRQRSSEKLMPVLNEADKLLDKSTGSLAGAGVDMLAGAFGKSTPGAQAAAQLKALEGAIIMNQPRMEGPQSDKDTALYRQMAGMIGDSTIPIETRRAALGTIKELHMKYAGQQLEQPKASGKKSAISSGGFSSKLISE